MKADPKNRRVAMESGKSPPSENSDCPSEQQCDKRPSTWSDKQRAVGAELGVCFRR